MRIYPYFDTHCDTLPKLYNEKKDLFENDCHVSIKKILRYRCPVQTFAIFNEGALCGEDILKMIAFLKQQCEKYKRYIHFETGAYGIERSIRYGKATALLSLEGVGNQKDFRLSDIEKYYLKGVRILSLGWNQDNCLTGGIERNVSGITPLGYEVLSEMKRLKMIPDVSHISEQGFWELIECYDKPILASHSNSRAVCNHLRNLTDEQFTAIVKSGGVVGINFYPPFVSKKKANIEAIVAHIDHFMELGGENAVGIGADFDGIDTTPEDLCNVSEVYKLFDALLARNYKESTINKIAFYNFYNLFRKYETLN